MKRFAKVTSTQGQRTPNGVERVYRVRGGKKGTGKQIGFSVTCWPWSTPSMDAAEKILDEIIEHNDLSEVRE